MTKQQEHNTRMRQYILLISALVILISTVYFLIFETKYISLRNLTIKSTLYNTGFIFTLIVTSAFLSTYSKTLIFFLKKGITKYPIHWSFVASLSLFLLGTDLVVLFLFFIVVLGTSTILSYLSGHENNPPFLDLDEDHATKRTEGIVSQILKSLQNTRIRTINLDGDWGTGKTHILKRLNNQLLEANDEFIPIYIPLDQLDSTHKIIDSFSSSLNKEIYRISGIRSQINIGSFIRAFTDLGGSNGIVSILMKLLPKSHRFIDNLGDIPELKDKRILVIIDDLDRVLSLSELKFVFEFITYLKEYSDKFRIVYSSSNRHLHPLIGYQLLKSTGRVDDELADAIGGIELNTHKQGYVSRNFHSKVIDESIFEGKLYMDKYRDLPIKLPPLEDSTLTQIFFKELNESGIEKAILEEASSVLSGDNIIPFEGDFRVMKKLAFFLSRLDSKALNAKEVDFVDTIILSFQIIEDRDFLDDLHTNVRFEKSHNNDYPVIIGDRYDFELYKILAKRPSNQGSFRNPSNLDKYRELFS